MEIGSASAKFTWSGLNSTNLNGSFVKRSVHEFVAYISPLSVSQKNFGGNARSN